MRSRLRNIRNGRGVRTSSGGSGSRRDGGDWERLVASARDIVASDEVRYGGPLGWGDDSRSRLRAAVGWGGECIDMRDLRLLSLGIPQMQLVGVSRMAGRMMSSQAELTTQQAAELLNVSGTFLVRLLESGAIPFHRVGTQRQVRLVDVLAYRRERSRVRRTVLAEMAREAQELGLYQ